MWLLSGKSQSQERGEGFDGSVEEEKFICVGMWSKIF